MEALKHILVKAQKSKMVTFMASNPEAFEPLVLLATSQQQPYAWKAAWLLSNVMQRNDDRLRGHILDIVNSLQAAPDGHKRELMNVLFKMELEEEHEGLVFDVALEAWSKRNSIPSVRWSALRLVMKVVKNYPELYPEVQAVTQDDDLFSLSPGIKRSIEKDLRRLG